MRAILPAALLLLSGLPVAVWAQNVSSRLTSLRPLPRIGGHAPPLSIETVFPSQPLDGLNWDDLRGTVVVLEFWATWCAPCVKQIPHLNDLAATFANQPVRFISITDEEPERVAKFLKTHRISGWIGSNPSRSQFRAYGVRGIPSTVLVDQNGVIQGMTDPGDVTEAVLNDLMAGKRLNVIAIR